MQRRLAVYQIQMMALVGLPVTLIFASIGLWRDLAVIKVLTILSGAIPLGLLFGFFHARRISAKCGAAGVFRRKAISDMSTMSVLLVLVAVLLPFLVFVYVFLYLTFSGRLVIPLSTLTAFDAALFLAVVGFGLLDPLGIILFERRTGFRLWIVGSPSLWLPDWIEFRRDAVGVPPLVN